jgi:hypothetical protein
LTDEFNLLIRSQWNDRAQEAFREWRFNYHGSTFYYLFRILLTTILLKTGSNYLTCFYTKRDGHTMMTPAKPRLPFAQAFEQAQEAYEALRPYCTRIEIVGSIRRQREFVGDIELLVIPRLVPAGLFSDELEVDPGFCAVVRRWRKVKGEPTGKYTQRVRASARIRVKNSWISA